MRIIIIISGLPPVGGAEKVAWDLAVNLKGDHEVHVITFCDENKTIDIDGVTVHCLAIIPHTLWYYMTIGRKQILNIANQIKPDVINAHMHSIIAFVLRHYSAKKVLTLHNSEYKFYIKSISQKLKHKYITLRTINRFDNVTTVSKHMQLYFKEYFNKNIELISNGIDLNRFKRIEKISRKRNTILYVGRLVEFKGVKIIFKLAAKLKKFNFILIGQGPLYKSVDLPNVSFEGIKQAHEVARYYNESFLSIFPSSYENFPIVGLEAMACGSIVIANDIKGFKEYIVNGSNGFLVNMKNHDLVVKKIKETEVSDSLDCIKQNAYDTVKKYGWKQITKNYVKLYSS